MALTRPHDAVIVTTTNIHIHPREVAGPMMAEAQRILGADALNIGHGGPIADLTVFFHHGHNAAQERQLAGFLGELADVILYLQREASARAEAQIQASLDDQHARMP